MVRSTPAPRVRKTRRDFGVNVAGHLRSEKGVGEAVRSMIRILETARIPYALNDFSDPGAVNNDLTFTDCSDRNPYRVNLIVLGTDAVTYFVKEKGPQYFA